jgi:hypothetical protein
VLFTATATLHSIPRHIRCYIEHRHSAALPPLSASLDTHIYVASGNVKSALDVILQLYDHYRDGFAIYEVCTRTALYFGLSLSLSLSFHRYIILSCLLMVSSPLQ